MTYALRAGSRALLAGSNLVPASGSQSPREGRGAGQRLARKPTAFTSLTMTVQIHLPRVTCRDGIQSYYEARIIPHMSRSPPNSMITGTAPPAPQVRLRTALPGLAGVVRWYPAVRYGPDSSPL